jgi:hypothetical protein
MNPSKLLTLLLILAIIVSAQTIPAQAASTTVKVEPNQSIAKIGEPLTVNITVNDVENLYGIDLTLTWDNTILSLTSAMPTLGVETYPTGVLHEASDAPVSIVENNASQQTGQYRLVATSQNPASSFNGTGNIATLTFNVTKTGNTQLAIVSELADHPIPEQTSEQIVHTDASGSLEVVIPEFPSITILALFLIGAACVLLFSKRLLKRPNLIQTRKI